MPYVLTPNDQKSPSAEDDNYDDGDDDFTDDYDEKPYQIGTQSPDSSEGRLGLGDKETVVDRATPAGKGDYHDDSHRKGNQLYDNNTSVENKYLDKNVKIEFAFDENQTVKRKIAQVKQRGKRAKSHPLNKNEEQVSKTDTVLTVETFGKMDKKLVGIRKPFTEDVDFTLKDFLADNLNMPWYRQSVSGNTATKSKNLLNNSDVSGFAAIILDFYNRFKNDQSLFRTAKLCPCCDEKLTSRGEDSVLNHLHLHMRTLDEKLEKCTRCHIILLPNWIKHHNCIGKIDKLNHLATYFINDIRDELAAFTMKMCVVKSKTDTKKPRCNQCNVIFSDIFCLKYHFLMKHVFVYRHEDPCGTEFTDFDAYHVHMSAAGVELDQHKKCNLCTYTFTTSQELKVM